MSVSPRDPVVAASVIPGAPLGLASLVSSFQDLAEQAVDYGYWAVLLVVAGDGVLPLLPGETAIVAAAVAAASGELSLPLVILAGTVGAMLGDHTAFWIGRRGGGPIRRLLVRMAGEERLVASERMVERHGAALVFVGRFLPALRIAVNLSCGAGQMAYGRFTLFNMLGAVVWSTQAALLGYFLGKAFADQLWVALVVAIAVIVLVGAFVGVRERRRVRAERAHVETEGGPAPAP